MERWRQTNVVGEIEKWMTRYKEAKKNIYKFGMSQPPWLLALAGQYLRLGPEWNCRGLGREFLDKKELTELKSQGVGKDTLKKLGSKSAGDRSRPYVATCTSNARLLHFNGGMKPWKREKWRKEQLASLCLKRDKSGYV